MSSEDLLRRITTRLEQYGGRPSICGMRIRIADISGLLANGLCAHQVVDELPDLELAYVQPALASARRLTDHFNLAA